MAVIERAQVVRLSLADCFAYFSNPSLLPQLTPASLRLVCTPPVRDRIFEGCEIDYTIEWMRVPLRWRTRIVVYDEPHRFVDMQIRGPYRYWWHVHRFAALGDGSTLMVDRIEYELPLGAVGSLVTPLVRRSLERILDYRAAVVGRLGHDSGPVIT